MATMTPAKRKEMQDAIFKFFKMIDPSGMNEKFYRDRFEGMSDTEFEIGRASCRERCRSRWSPYH